METEQALSTTTPTESQVATTPTESQVATKEKRKPYVLLTDEQLAGYAEPEFLIDGVLVQQSLAVLYGAWGSFKSFLAIDWALCLATGLPWQGRETARCDVLYAVGEGVTGTKLRIAAWKKKHGIAAPIPGLRLITGSLELMDREKCRELAEAIEAEQANGFCPGLIICDTLSRAMAGADESSKKDMSTAIMHADRIRWRFPATFLLVHHSGKDETRGARGSTDLPGSADTLLRLTRHKKSSDAELLVEKQKDFEDGARIAIGTERIDLPPHPRTGKERSSLVIVPGGPRVSPLAELMAGGSQAAKALTILSGLLTASGGNPIAEAAWRDACHLSESTSPEAQGKAFRRAAEKLEESGAIRRENGMVELAR